jgi:uncharacterized protein (TIGR02284 family)
MSMHAVEERTASLNSLLRGEMSAVETYTQAIEKFKGDMIASRLHSILEDHREAVTQLRQHIGVRGGKADQTSGAWGSFAKLVEGTAKMFGKTAALKALKEGEELGISDYNEALEDEHLDIECKTLVRSTLLPRTRGHLTVLDQLMDSK